jgi:hypothetical protein
MTVIYLCTAIARRLNRDLPECDYEADNLACLARCQAAPSCLV